MKVFILYIFVFLLLSCNINNNQKIAFQSLNGSITLEQLNGNKLNAIIFLAPGCPLSEASLKELNRLDSLYHHHHYSTTIVIPGNLYSIEEVENFRDTFQIKFPLIIDTNYFITNLLNADITPEYFIVDENMIVLYEGAIDNRALDNDVIRQKPTVFYADLALSSIINKKNIVYKKTKAVGCFIEK